MSKRSLMWVYFLFSIPYGKGKANLTKEKETIMKFQFHMGKVKQRHNKNVKVRNLFQFHMGKVKKVRVRLVSIPYGKGKVIL